MKPIKLKRENEQKIDAALATVNGKARTHSYGSMWDLTMVADKADRMLAGYGIPKKQWVGAAVTAVSGDRVPNAYNRKGHTRIATKVTLERRATGWFLTEIGRTEIYQEGGSTTLYLTEQQDEIAVRILRMHYRITKRQHNAQSEKI